MKAKILIYCTILISLFSCSGGTPIPPFGYSDNVRIIVEGKLYNQSGGVLSNQSVVLYGISGSSYVVLQTAVSDNQGGFFITCPKGNNPIYILFTDKNVFSAGNNGSLIRQFQNIGLGYLNNTYYNFSSIILTN